MFIECQDIKKEFQSGRRASPVQALRGVQLSVEKGELLAIKGASGSGKSTLLHILGCLDRPTGGTYRLDGEDVSRLSFNGLARIRNRKIGFVMQHFALIDEDTALQNVSAPMLFGRMRLSLINGMALHCLRQLGIEHLADKRTATLSGGEKQRVAIARAIVNDPELILADEPTGALDAKNSEMVMDLLQSLHEQGKTVIIVTHEELVSSRCERVVCLVDGQCPL